MEQKEIMVVIPKMESCEFENAEIVAGCSSALPLNMTKSHKTKAKAGLGGVQSNQTLVQQSSVVSPLTSAQVNYYDPLLIAFLGNEV